MRKEQRKVKRREEWHKQMEEEKERKSKCQIRTKKKEIQRSPLETFLFGVLEREEEERVVAEQKAAEEAAYRDKMAKLEAIEAKKRAREKEIEEKKRKEEEENEKTRTTDVEKKDLRKKPKDKEGNRGFRGFKVWNTL